MLSLKIVLIIVYSLFILENVRAQDINAGIELYKQASYYLNIKDYKSAFLYFSGSCYNSYLPGCDMMGIAQYAVDKKSGVQICENWVNRLRKKDNSMATKHLQSVLHYYIKFFTESKDKKIATYFTKQYNKMFLHIQIESVNSGIKTK